MTHLRDIVRAKFAADGDRVKAERNGGPLALLTLPPHASHGDPVGANARVPRGGVSRAGADGGDLIAIAFGAAGYVVQKFVHAACQQVALCVRVLSALRRNHMLHHCQNESCNFGILFGWWGIAFGTTLQRKVRRWRGGAGRASAVPSET